jgi:hypothetical protein
MVPLCFNINIEIFISYIFGSLTYCVLLKPSGFCVVLWTHVAAHNGNEGTYIDFLKLVYSYLLCLKFGVDVDYFFQLHALHQCGRTVHNTNHCILHCAPTKLVRSPVCA